LTLLESQKIPRGEKMRVEKVWINKFKSGKLLGFADIMFSLRDDGNGIFTIKGFKIFRDDDGNGVQVALPSKKEENGKYYPLVSVNIEDPDGVAFMDHIKEKVAIAYQGAKDTNTERKGKPDRSSDQIKDNPDPSGIPF